MQGLLICVRLHSVLPAMKRFCLGLVCLSIFTIAGPYYPDSYYLTDDFEVSYTEDTLSRTLLLHASIGIYNAGLTLMESSHPWPTPHPIPPQLPSRLSLSGTDVCSFCSGPRSTCTSMSAAGLFQ